MIWEARTKRRGDWIEANFAVARNGQDYSWVGRFMMHSDEWQDFTRQFGLREGDDGVWRSDGC